MIDELKKALTPYQTSWRTVVVARSERAFFEALKPTAVAWKVEDLAELERCFADLRELCDQIHFGWVNERWLVTLHLKTNVLPWNVRVIKLMQRRPGASDAVGLDHVDFYHPEVSADKLRAEPELKWSEGNNGEHCKWLSIWFENTEAKLRTDTTLQACINELLDTQKQIIGVDDAHADA